jgi:NADH:ubiquinone oxidoreductase subunit 3 (subunit A)
MRKSEELITDASSPVRKSVAYECGVGGSTEKRLCQFPRNYLVVLLDIALHYFISRIK